MPSDDYKRIVVPVTPDQAIVIEETISTSEPAWGNFVSDLTRTEWTSLLQALDPATRGIIESQKLTGRLVELDRTSRKLLKTAQTITEDGGWIQANLRDHGKVTRIMRIRPATGLAVASGAVNILSALAAQAQMAKIEKDLEIIRGQLDTVIDHLRDEQLADVESIVAQVDRIAARVRNHGKRGATKSELASAAAALHTQSHRAVRHLRTAVAKAEAATGQGPRKANATLTQQIAQSAAMNYTLLAMLYIATTQLGWAQVAREYHSSRPDVAAARARETVDDLAAIRFGMDELSQRIRQVDTEVRKQFKPEWHLTKSLSPFHGEKDTLGKGVVALSTAARPTAPLMAVAAAGGAATFATAGLHDCLRANAQRELEPRLAAMIAAAGSGEEAVSQVQSSVDSLGGLIERGFLE